MAIDLPATLTAVAGVLGAVAWPATVLIAVALLRRPIARSLEGVGSRITKLSVGQFAVDLAATSATRPGMTIDDTDLRRPTVAQVIDSSSVQLFQQMSDPTASDYAVVNIGRGDRWLTSRLFLFAVFLKRMRDLRAFVFVETLGDVHRRFVAIAAPDAVRWSLARRYPILESAWAAAYGAKIPAPGPGIVPPTIQSVSGAMDPFVATTVARTFLEYIQSPPVALPPDQVEWVALPDTQPPTMERARWINGDVIDRDLRDVIDRDSWITDDPDVTASERVRAILRREGRYVAILAPDGRFKDLVDREALLEKAAKVVGESSQGN
jgi:hypothetical protein